MTHHGLSAREIEIIELAAEGITDKEIASRLGLGLGTVSTYWVRCRTKLGVGTRAACVASLLTQNRPTTEASEPWFEARWNALMDTTGEAVAVVAPNGRVSMASRAFLKLVRSTLAELRRKGTMLTDRLTSLASVDAFSGNGAVEAEPHTLRFEDGTSETVYVSSVAVEHSKPRGHLELLVRIERP